MRPARVSDSLALSSAPVRGDLVRVRVVLSGKDLCPGSRWSELVGLLRALPDGELGRAELLTEECLLEEEGPLRVYWIPFERLNRAARIAIIGLTPGWYQMRQAFSAARDAFRAGAIDELGVLDHVARQAGFAGATRTNMVGMLDAIGLADALGIRTSAELFGQRDDLIHGTSALRYPVFVDGENYRGANPRVDRSPMLTRSVHSQLATELAEVSNALLLPLGSAVEGCLRMLIAARELDETRCLFGFPHPSGANGHRANRFRRNESALRAELARWTTKFG